MDIKQLKTLLKVLRDNGVVLYEHDGIKLTLSDLPVSKESFTESKTISATKDDYEEPTQDDLLFYSSPANSEA